MLKEERFNHILTVIKKKGKANYESLASDLNVSPESTRWRHIPFKESAQLPGSDPVTC